MPVAVNYLVAQRRILRQRSDDHVLEWLSGKQHGVGSRRQLIGLGFSSEWISRRVRRGALRRIYNGVYQLGHGPLTEQGRRLAAVLFLGDGAVTTHRCAMAQWKLGAWTGFPELTVPRRLPPRRGLIIHRATLPADETMVLRGIPVTKPSRTLFDLAAVLDERPLRRALNEAAYLGLPLSPSLPELIERHPRRRGVAKLKAILGEGRIGLERSESDFEEEFAEWLRARAFPEFVQQLPVTVGDDDYRLDFAWPERMVAVELDTPTGHDHPAAIERDKRKDRRVRSIGWSVLRVTPRAFELECEDVEADLRAALALAVP
jgi:very-short-patch-repair endonuclease